jgi:HK97 family phage major capsid protein
MLQSSPDAEKMVQDDLATTLAVEVDRAALHGSGASNEPTGLLSTTGVNSVAIGTDGGTPTMSHVEKLVSVVASANASEADQSFLTNSKVRGLLKQTYPNTTAGDTPLWTVRSDGRGDLNGFRAEVSNNVSSELDKGSSTGVCSALIFGSWKNLVLPLWGGLDVLLDPFSLSTTGQLRVVAFQSLDVGIRHPEAFSVCADILTV